MQTRFSVIVPIYNKEKYIKECIDSVLNQSFTDYELILVDDGSTDNSKQIIDDYANKNKQIKIIHKENKGLVSARIAGTKLATSEYIVCLDADDYIKNDFLQTINNEIENNHPDMVCFGYTELNTNKETIIDFDYRKGYYTKKDIIKEIYPSLIQEKDTKHFNVSIWSKAYKKELYTKVQLNVDIKNKIGEDGCVSIPCIYLANSLSIIKNNSYVYRNNDDSMTSIKAVLKEEFPKLVYKEYTKYINKEEYDFNDQLNRFVTHQVFSLVIFEFNRNESYKDIKKRILNILNDDFYNKCINESKFSNNIYASMMHIILKYKLVYIIYLLNKLK